MSYFESLTSKLGVVFSGNFYLTYLLIVFTVYWPKPDFM
jgi:hypothetical protein